MIVLDVFTAIELWQVQNTLDFGFILGKGSVHLGFMLFAAVVSFVHYFIIELQVSTDAD